MEDQKILTEEQQRLQTLINLKSKKSSIDAEIYRIDASGRKLLCGKHSGVLESDFVGRKYGPGEYEVSYQHIENGTVQINTFSLFIAEDYRQLYEQENKSNGASYLDSVRNTNSPSFIIEQLLPLVPVFKGLFGNDNSDLRVMVDNQNALMQTMIQANMGRNENVSDAVLKKLIDVNANREPEDMFKSVREAMKLMKSMGVSQSPVVAPVESKKDLDIESMVEKVLNGVAMLKSNFINPEMITSNPEFQNVIQENDLLTTILSAVKEKYGPSDLIEIGEKLGIPDKVKEFLEGE